MDDVVTAITTAVTPTALFGALESVAPIVTLGILVGFGLTLLRKAVRKIGHGKGGF